MFNWYGVKKTFCVRFYQIIFRRVSGADREWRDVGWERRGIHEFPTKIAADLAAWIMRLRQVEWQLVSFSVPKNRGQWTFHLNGAVWCFFDRLFDFYHFSISRGFGKWRRRAHFYIHWHVTCVDTRIHHTYYVWLVNNYNSYEVIMEFKCAYWRFNCPLQ